MADDAFALSPISARPMQPGDSDYEAIREAFVETSRGRWFLNEYTKRNRNSDTHMVLDAVARIEQTVAKAQEAAAAPAQVLAQVRAMIAQARTQAEFAMASDAAAEALDGARKGSRIVREISWSLRETGTDSRICDILDGQLAKIDEFADVVAHDSRRAAVLAAFDLLQQKMGTIEGSLGPAAPVIAESEASVAEPTAADIPLETAVLTEPAGETAASVHDDSFARDAGPVSDMAIGETSIFTDPHDGGFGILATDDHFADEAADDDHGMVAPVGPTTRNDDDDEMNFGDDVEFAPTEADIAEDDAVLDLVASEMAAPDDLAFEDADSAAPHDAAAPNDDAPLESSPVLIVAAAAPVAPVQPSLGETLLANGLLRQPAASDPLAPFRRMSQAEKIAFFS